MTQDEALAILESGAHVLLTGAAGTGKTYTLNQFITRAREDGKTVAVTATTGLAATHLGGNTIHSWSGIGIHDELPRSFAEKMSKQRRETVNSADILIIDEISMLHDFRLDLINQALQAGRGNQEPFGGVQVVLCGDFFQLPPVNRHDSRQGGFITTSDVWNDDLFTVCYLEQQYRQAEDQSYADILNGIRAGQLRRSQLDKLQSRANIFEDPFMPPTRLLTTNVDVDVINQKHLKHLSGTSHTYLMSSSGSKQYVETLKRSCLAPETLELKLGAQVMCIKNSQERKYVNGSLGQVIDFEDETDLPVVKLLNDKIVTIKPDTWELRDGDKKRASLTQLPLRLAWAITVHKSQGMTLDAARIDLSRAFVEGMGYVALSRVRGLQYLMLDGLNNMALKTSPLARNLDATLRDKSRQALQQHASDISAWHAKEAVRSKKPKKKAKHGWFNVPKH